MIQGWTGSLALAHGVNDSYAYILPPLLPLFPPLPVLEEQASGKPITISSADAVRAVTVLRETRMQNLSEYKVSDAGCPATGLQTTLSTITRHNVAVADQCRLRTSILNGI